METYLMILEKYGNWKNIPKKAERMNNIEKELQRLEEVPEADIH